MIILWYLWKARNDLCFKKKEMDDFNFFKTELNYLTFLNFENYLTEF